MEMMNWEAAAALVGVVGIIAGSLVTIFKRKKDPSVGALEGAVAETRAELNDARTRLTVLESKHEDLAEGLQDEIVSLRDSVSRLDAKLENLMLLLLKREE